MRASHVSFSGSRPASGMQKDSVVAPLNGVSEETLLNRIRANDEDAFGALFIAYYPGLCRFVTTFVGSPDIAKELVQDVFFRVWEHRGALNVYGSIRAYLFGAARNHAINYLKHERVGSRIFESATAERRIPAIGRGFGGADESLYHNELATAFHAATQQLPERQRTMLDLRWRHHLSHADIAEILGISIKGVETQLGRALKTLRARLAKFR